MTHLEANIKDLKILHGECGEPVCWEFRFSKCESLKETIGELKRRIPPDQRQYFKDPEGYVWRVSLTKKNWWILAEVIDNFPILEEVWFTITKGEKK